jgi:Tol biopolymer transport system component
LTGQVELLYQIDHITGIAWSPDGSKLAFEVGPPGVPHQVFMIDARDGKEISRFAGEQPAWKPNGEELAVKACSPECGLWQVGLDGRGGKLLTNDGTDSYPTWSPADDYLAFSSRSRSGDWEIYRLRLSDGELQQLTERSGTDTTPVFSPDGREIYFRTDAFGTWEIRAMAADGSNERVVRTNVGHSDDWGRAKPAVN